MIFLIDTKKKFNNSKNILIKQLKWKQKKVKFYFF